MIMEEVDKVIFIVCAMKREAQVIIDCFDDVIEKVRYGFSFYEINYKGTKLVISISGPGLINMSSCLTITFTNYEIEYLINYGMAGGIGEDIHKGDIIIGNECININSYVTSQLSSGIDIDNWNLVTFTDGGEDKLVVYEGDKSLVDVALRIKINSKVSLGMIGSGDVWDREIDKLKLLSQKYKVSCEDMEAISVYQLANRFRIPTISIKGISNNESSRRYCF